MQHGADNGTRTRNTTLEGLDVTVTLYLHIDNVGVATPLLSNAHIIKHVASSFTLLVRLQSSTSVYLRSDLAFLSVADNTETI